ncbi:hypothetical protein PF005_g14922 [Phytophthora fragariae]|uniref:DUF659 domain-containing protein n=1 Tax=Phytophthora fragariae TaxID=53985 RepID=A0A6A3Z0C1_9STRA|nr:hypothetical protein PF003_g23245 [Phytophthora fragariae]KAE8937800.1 hypothetical protein PF009_g12303 [Phytophthora fragariae]KAE9109060.1 hypothetical protein PF007_g12395 [Phytophthora fragariae]KAE9144235.1 hypothetical protein PF006_g10813 [Phytophthora fragariae]KAE9201526.1 hypothetical protein PF005_g14922 [Phytophthora fragariae]
MQRFHMEVLLKAKQAKEEAKALKAKRQLENCYDMIPATSKRQPVAVTSDQQDYSNDLAAKWVAQSMRPLTIVEDPGLFEWIRFLTEDLGGIIVGVPGATQLRDDVGRVVAELRSSLKARIRISFECFCITNDIWTSRRAQSYMALTLHYLEEDFTMCNWTLEVEIFPWMHTGLAIVSGLKAMMER